MGLAQERLQRMLERRVQGREPMGMQPSHLHQSWRRRGQIQSWPSRQMQEEQKRQRGKRRLQTLES